MSGFALFNRVARIRAVGTVLLLVLDYVSKALLMLVYLVSAQNKLNINDWSAVQSLFDKLNKQMEKTQKAADSVGTPRVYIKMLVELEVTTHCISEQHMNTFWAKASTAAQEARAAGLLVKLSRRKGAFVGPVVIHFFVDLNAVGQHPKGCRTCLCLDVCSHLKCAAVLAQDRLNATLANKELTKKMSPTNAKALNTMRQRLRKHNPQFTEEIEKFRWRVVHVKSH